MEHRWSARASVPVTVTIYSQGQPVLTTVTSNLSRQGVLLEAEASELGNARSVELGFEFASAGRRQFVRLPAYVIHRDGGIGLMFTDHSTHAVKGLERLLHSSHAPAAGLQA